MNKLKPTILAAVCASMLGACGGGDGSGAPADSAPPTSPTSPATPTLTGKAIDGYLVGATVCLDQNDNGACDASEPTTVTDASGNYGLVVADSAVGKKILVVVDANTHDLSRPGYVFPSSFVLSAVVDGTPIQHITPITTMSQALIESGKSREAAQKAIVSLVGGVVNVKDDYIATGDNAANAFAAAVVDKILELAAGGRSDADTVRAVMNAIVTKGSIAAVTLADVNAAKTKPVYISDVDPSTLLADTMYTYAGTRSDFDANKLVSVAAIRRSWMLNGLTLQSNYEEQALSTDVWSPSSTGAAAVAYSFGQYALKTDGTWAPFTAASDIDGNLAVQAINGNIVTASDTVTGMPVRLEYRRTVLDGKSYVDAMPAGTQSDFLALLNGTFTTSTTGYAVITTRSMDSVTIRASTECHYGENPIIEDGVVQCPLLGTPANTYTSVQDVLTIGPVPFPPIGPGYLRFGPNGQLAVYDSSDASKILLDNTKISWSIYPRNPDVMVLNAKYEDIADADSMPLYLDILYDYRHTYRDLLKSGAKFVIALHNGHLRYGLLVPAGTEELTPLLKKQGFDQLTTVIKAALSTW
ncbi:MULTISPECIES: hypothetical protein [Cupriavidus]|uniref:Lipoprotein n=1 Tax=Cupriavidus campinensis TaxID=151783 RepID=A0ABY3EUX0_9BURK|nr:MULTISPECIES: hypothetical protein [Cupriavidus]TSP14659.1 hypothetical protein FGG12_03180 [Cupriavidus campinensis]